MSLMTLATMLPLLLLAPPQGSSERVDINVIVGTDVRYFYRDGIVNEVQQNMNLGLIGAAGAGHQVSDNGYTGRMSLLIDGAISEQVKVRVEIENKTVDGDTNGNGVIDSGDNLRFGQDAIKANIEQAYLQFDGVIAAPLRIQLGVIDLSYKLRPSGEAFLLDTNESESFYSLNTASSAVRNYTARDTQETVGFKARWDNLVWAADLFAATVREGGAPQNDESLYGLFAEIRPREYISFFGILMLSDGPVTGSSVWTAGMGADYHVTKNIELFGEIYSNFGTLRDDPSASPAKISKKGAYGLEGGARGTMGKLWGEISYWILTGDKDPVDNEDNAFQSYENNDRFLIVEDDEFGLDIDTNYQALKLSVGLLPIPLNAKESTALRLTIDLGVFEFDQDLYSPAGIKYFRKGGNDIGKEVDFTAAVDYNRNLLFFLKTAYLFGSDFLESLNERREDSALMLLIGTQWSY